MVGDYLGTMPSLFDKLNIPSPALKSSIHPAKVEDRSKLISAMNVLSVEDPSLTFGINADNNELEVFFMEQLNGKLFWLCWRSDFR